MSTWVVSPTGIVAEYPDGIQIKPQNNGSLWIYGAADRFVAMAPLGSLVSFSKPLGVTSAPGVKDAAINNAIEIAALCVDQCDVWPNRKRLKMLKRKLARFDSRSCTFVD